MPTDDITIFQTLNSAAAEYYRGRRIVMNENVMLEQTAEEWLASVRERVAGSTYVQYHMVTKKYILPAIGSRMCRALRGQDITAFLEECQTKPSYRGDFLSPSTVGNIRTVLRMILQYGTDRGYIPAFQVRYRIAGSRSIQGRCLSTKDARRMEAYLSGTDNVREYGLTLCLDMGLRLGELCALQWEDIDLENGILHIRKTVKKDETKDTDGNPKYQWIIGVPKSQKSYRDIPIPVPIEKRLKEFHSSVTDESCYFLNGRKDRFVLPRSYQASFRGYLKKMGIGDINIHALRHSFATRCLAKSDARTVSELLGHSSPSVTMNIYIHSTMETKRKAVNSISFRSGFISG